MSDITDALGENFDPNSVEISSYDPIPAGDYAANIVDAEIKANKAGNGMIMKVELAIVGGPQDGRKVFDHLNLSNPSQKAVAIAKETLAKLSLATSVDVNASGSQGFIGKRVAINVEIDGAYNRIKNYKPLVGVAGGQAPQAAQSAPAPAQEMTAEASPQAQSNGTPPWAS